MVSREPRLFIASAIQWSSICTKRAVWAVLCFRAGLAWDGGYGGNGELCWWLACEDIADGCHSKIELDFIFPEKLLLEVNMDDHFLKEYANISTQRSRSITNEDRYAWEYYLHILDKEISKYDFHVAYAILWTLITILILSIIIYQCWAMMIKYLLCKILINIIVK